MSRDKILPKTGPQIRLASYHNRSVGAVWVMILIGAITMIEQYVRFYKDIGMALGVYSIDLINPAWLAMTVGLTCGVLLIVGGVFIGFGRAWLPIILTIGLTLDLIDPIVLLLNTKVRDAFPLIITIIIRLIALRFLVRGLSALSKRRDLQNTMAAAVKEHDQGLNAAEPQPDAQTAVPETEKKSEQGEKNQSQEKEQGAGDSPFGDEDKFQG